MSAHLLKHQLLVLQDQGPVLCWWLHAPDEERVELVFTPTCAVVSLWDGANLMTWHAKLTLPEFRTLSDDELLRELRPISAFRDYVLATRRRFVELYDASYSLEVAGVPIRRPEARLPRVVP